MKSPTTRAPDRGDIVWLTFSPQVGREQSGRRPALILSPRDYNARIGLALVCPITSKVKGYPFEVLLPDDAPAKGAVLCDHVKSLDWRGRDAKPIGSVSIAFLAQVVARIRPLLSW